MPPVSVQLAGREVSPSGGSLFSQIVVEQWGLTRSQREAIPTSSPSCGAAESDKHFVTVASCCHRMSPVKTCLLGQSEKMLVLFCSDSVLILHGLEPLRPAKESNLNPPEPNLARSSSCCLSQGSALPNVVSPSDSTGSLHQGLHLSQNPRAPVLSAAAHLRTSGYPFL